MIVELVRVPVHHSPVMARKARVRACALVLLVVPLALTGCDGGDGPASPSPSASTSRPVTPTPSATGATATPTPPTATPTSTPSATPSTVTGAEQVTAWFVRSAETALFLEPLTVELEAPTLGVARAAMEALVRGPDTEKGLTTLAPPGTEVLGVDRDGALLTVDLSEEVRTPVGGAAGEAAFAQQLAWTGTQFEGVEAVGLLVAGEPVAQLWGHLDWSQPVTRDEFALSPVIIDEPEPGAVVSSGSVTAAGSANVFEATLIVRLHRPDGSLAEEAVVTATCGTGCRGAWEQTFTGLQTPGEWMIEAEETDPSGGEGRPPFRAAVRFQVR